MSMTAEPVAWFVDWPGEPDLGHFLGEEPVEGARNRALVFRDAAPVSAEPVGYVSKQAIERFQDGRHADIYPSIEELTHEFFDATPMALYAAPVATVSAEPAQIGYIKIGVDGCPRAQLTTAFVSPGIVWPDNTAIYAAPVAAQAHPTPTVPAETLRVCGVIADKIEDGSLFQSGIYRNSELAGFVRQVLRSVSAAQAQPAMPPLTDAMRAVIRNEHDVYGDEDALYAALCAAAQAQPLPDSLIPAAPDLEYLRSMADSTALPAFLRGQIAAAVKALEAQAQQPVSGADGLDERAAFERFTRYSEDALSRDAGDGYCIKGVDNEWRAWLARAALAQQDADKADALNKARSELWAIAHTYDDHELRDRAKEAYEMTEQAFRAAIDAARKELT